MPAPADGFETYTVLVEGGGGSFGAYLPDLPGCVAVGRSEAEVRRLIREAVGLHLAGMREDGDPIPPPTTTAFSLSITEADAAAAALPDPEPAAAPAVAA